MYDLKVTLVIFGWPSTGIVFTRNSLSLHSINTGCIFAIQPGGCSTDSGRHLSGRIGMHGQCQIPHFK